ncbi:MAG TPA: porin [Pirellulales bacterium]|nr:porin [Pirellulales bacterium]
MSATQSKRWTVVLSMALVGFAATASAQQDVGTPPGPPPVAAIALAPPPAQVDQTQEDPRREIEELRERLERCEAQLQAGGMIQPPANSPAGAPEAVAGYLPAAGPANFGGYAQLPPEDGERLAGTVPIITGPTLHVGGKALLDNVMISQSPQNHKQLGTEDDYTGFRYMRLQFYGDLYENIDYRVEIDLAQNLTVLSSTEPHTAFQDVWTAFHQLPVAGNIRLGYFKEPFSLEEQPGEEYLLFMERSLVNTFVPARRIGVMAYNDVADDKNATWFVGTFREGFTNLSTVEYSNEGDYGITCRLAELPYYDESTNGRYLLHLGAAYEYTGANTSSIVSSADSKTFKAVPEANVETPFATAVIPCNDFQLFGLEAAMIDGPWLVQSEYVSTLLSPLVGKEIYMPSAYLETTYILTGENHNYDRGGKFVAGVTPYEPFFRVRAQDGKICQGWGAWELAARVSYIDLNNDLMGTPGNTSDTGGRLLDYTVGGTWYLTSNCSFKFNYIHSDLALATGANKGKSVADIFGTRFEMHF